MIGIQTSMSFSGLKMPFPAENGGNGFSKSSLTREVDHAEQGSSNEGG